jgi:hypothetical protein
MSKKYGKKGGRSDLSSITKFTIDGQAMTAVSRDEDHQCQGPIFRNKEDACQPFIRNKNQYFVSHKKSTGKLTFCLQIEKDAKVNWDDNNSPSPNPMQTKRYGPT